MTYLSDEQVALLLKPIHPNRVLQLKGMSYVEGYEIRAELNRIFGFGRWSEEVLDQQLICETETKTNAGKAAWNVIYRSRVRLSFYCPDGSYLGFYDGAHVGENTHPVRGEAHGIALTASQTYALRRAAINLGDQFGLSLYNKGSLEPIVRWTLVRPEQVAADTDDVPVIAPEETPAEPAEAASETPAPRTSRRQPSAPKREVSTEPLTLEQIITKIAEAKTVDELRVAWKDAGVAGVLQTEIPTSIHGGTVTVQEYLYQMNDKLSPAKSDGTGTGDGGENPGEGKGGE